MVTLKEYRAKLRKRNPVAVLKVERDLAFNTAWLITEIRLRYGLTQEQLAKRTGLKQPSIARAEVHGASIGLLQKISDKLGVTIQIKLKSTKPNASGEAPQN